MMSSEAAMEWVARAVKQGHHVSIWQNEFTKTVIVNLVIGQGGLTYSGTSLAEAIHAAAEGVYVG